MRTSVRERNASDGQRDCCDTTQQGSDDGCFVDELHEFPFLGGSASS
jgi:hypothetical protein